MRYESELGFDITWDDDTRMAKLWTKYFHDNLLDYFRVTFNIYDTNKSNELFMTILITSA